MRKDHSFSILLFLIFGLNGLLVNAQNFEYKMIEALQSNRAPSSDKFYYQLSQSADAVGIATPIALGVRYLTHKSDKTKVDFLSSCVSTLGTYGLGYILKKSINRDRPFNTYPEFVPYTFKTSGSMPSGSTAIAFTSATNLTLAYKKWYVAVPAFSYATAVGFSRVKLAEHYPTDVAAGAVLGVGSVLISRKLTQWINK